MKRILFAALVIAAFQTDISAAEKRRRIADSADLFDECANDAAIAASLAELDDAPKQKPKKKPSAKRPGLTAATVDVSGVIDLTGKLAVDADKAAEVARLEAEIQAAKIAALQAQIALAKKEADQATKKVEAAQAATTGRSLFAYSGSLLGSMFGALSSSFGWRGRESALVPAAVGVAGATFVGLVNNGNMCYQNALMQAVHKCAPLRDALLRNFQAQRTAGVIMPAYVEEFFATQVALSGAVAPYNPIAFCRAIAANITVREPLYVPGVLANGTEGLVPTGVYRDRSIFSLGRQQDASEFPQVFWDRLQGAGIVPRMPAGNDGFHGIVSQDRLQCSTCHSVRVSHAIDYSTTLSLVIPDGDVACTMNDLIAHHSLGGDAAVACPTCMVDKMHEKKIGVSIDPAQQFMIIQVKRFSFDPLTLVRTKRSNPVTLPANGIVVMPGGARFKVVSALIHAGGAGNGHYWTVATHGVYNDDVVTPDGAAAMNELLTTGLHGEYGTGYLYFFERV